MMRLILLFCIIGISHATFSQNRFGVRGGLNIANQKQTLGYGENVVIKGEPIASFHIGAMYEIKTTRWLFIQPSLMLNGKGANFEEPSGDGKGKGRPYYLELPILLLAKTNLPQSDINIFGGAGPSFGYGIFGKEESQGGPYPVFYKGSKNRFDFGIDFTGGVELPSGWQFACHFIPGIANVSSDEPPEPWEKKNKVVSFSIGYFLSGRK